ncbi:IclR family transcriptional regulator [Geomobilimonas luticola]|uniref:IclR family transcriptional regulator n=1 Tax=Geomobilimonas luticola TaxID=1114878 RepID=A0ABS5SG07_9BACT|nr:IclR family transcriptional regulator [Geomobilimonas luticola]MBT0653444.1 IclR family transcriptional regulator [Geomobilimonas luticola]
MVKKNIQDYSVRTVENVFDILELITIEDMTQVTIPRLCSVLNISKNKAFRLMVTLEKLGIVERYPGSGNYGLGVCAVGLSQKILHSSNIIAHAHPVIEELARKHDEAVYMTVLKDDEVTFLDMVDCEQKVKAAPLIGKRFPYFSNAAGKVIRALETKELNKVFKRTVRKQDLCNLDLLENELADIRQKGVAVDCDGLGDGIISVAVAVRDYAGKVVGAITILGPSFRMLAERLENEIIPSLREGAEMLSGRFGYAK